MLRKGPVFLLIGAIVGELLFDTIFRALLRGGSIDWDIRTIIFVIVFISIIFKVMFFAIIIYYQQTQKRYVIFSILSIGMLLFYGLFYYNYLLYGGGQVFSDINIILGALALGFAIYISVDESTIPLAKIVIVGTGLLFVLYKTPLYPFFMNLVMQTFGTNYEQYYGVGAALQYVYHGVFLLWTIPQIMFVNKIDFV